MWKRVFEFINIIGVYLAPPLIIFQEYFVEDVGWFVRWFATLILVWVLRRPLLRFYKWCTQKGSIKNKKGDMLIQKPRFPILYIITAQGLILLSFGVFLYMLEYVDGNINTLIETMTECFVTVALGMMSGLIASIIPEERTVI